MSVTSFFTELGAPVRNQRTSWGARRPRDGAIFLRVWQDLKFVREDGTWMLVHEPWMNDKRIQGHEERRGHIAAIRAGAPCYLVMCVADDIDAKQRRIREFNDTQVFAGGDLLDTGPGFEYPLTIAPHVRRLTQAGATWIRLGARTPVSEVR